MTFEISIVSGIKNMDEIFQFSQVLFILQIFQTSMNYFSNGEKKVKFLFQGNTNKISSYVISSCLDT